MNLRRANPRRQRGTALLLAMVILTLVSTLAAGMVWQQWRAIEVEAAERARTQSAWILHGALDWARLILKEDARVARAEEMVDHLGEPWAVPLAEARLSTFLAADRENTDASDDIEAFLSGRIEDAQSRYNLRSLLDKDRNDAVDLKELAKLERLLNHAGLSTGLAQTIADGLSQAVANDAGAALVPTRLTELTWLGLGAEEVKRLDPYVTLLPMATDVNVNTAPREVLAAVLALNLGTAQLIVDTRERSPFKKPEQLTSLLGITDRPKGVGLNSNFFIVQGRLRLGDRVLEEESLVQRLDTRQVVPVYRRRVSLHLDDAAAR